MHTAASTGLHHRLYPHLRLLGVCGLAACLLVAAACAPAVPEAAGGPLRVAVSVPPQAWLVEAIGGARVDVVSVAGPGDSAETYQPSDAEVSRVLASRLYFRGGVPFERGSWFSALEAARGLEIVDLRRGLEMLPMGGARHDHAIAGGPRPRLGAANPGAADPGVAGPDVAGEALSADAADPHTWVSPRRLRVQAATVAEALSRVDPDHAAEYAAGLAATLGELDALDAELAHRLAPVAGRAFYVFHPAWGYLAADYGLRQVAIEVDGKHPSDAELTGLQRA